MDNKRPEFIDYSQPLELQLEQALEWRRWVRDTGFFGAATRFQIAHSVTAPVYEALQKEFRKKLIAYKE